MREPDALHWTPFDIVKQQAEDEGLWFVAQTAGEAYLQRALRLLHAAIEGKSKEQCAREVLDAAAASEVKKKGLMTDEPRR